MTRLELRPLALGEILDRTFSLYRRHFLLFMGISGIPQILVLALNLAQITVTGSATYVIALCALIVSLIAYLFSQGGTIIAVSELYLGRPTSMAESLRRVWNEMGALFGVVALNGLAIVGAALLLVIPGIYVTCRLLVCVPVALIEQRGPRESLSRSFDLTRDNAGRAFVIFLLYVILGLSAGFLFALPSSIGVATALKDPVMLRFWTAINQVAASVAAVLVRPILLIATSIFYYDLRVRKEGFDLQLLMNPDAQQAPRPSGLPSILS